MSDENAYVGYESGDVRVIGGEGVWPGNGNGQKHRYGQTVRGHECFDDGDVVLVNVTNRFAGSVAIEDVDVGPNAPFEKGDLTYPEDSNITSGDSHPIVWEDPNCDVLSTSTVALTVEVAGSGVWAEIDGDTATREIGVTCAPSEAVRFYGNNGKIKISALSEEVSVDYWTMNASGNDELAHEGNIDDVSTNDPLVTKGDPFNRQNNSAVVAVYLPTYGVAYVNPQYMDNITADQLNDDLVDVDLEDDRVLKGERNGN
ncbi:hypothetical protein [Halanaeroarchaeum sulfurireducens]|uniref:hypothetical protein n=1 Tax=Halanaeroarchaeum sulfurireducens TaxID=1604004 RepID=UPI0011875CBB|nr:hypothetical protein [Halanaeroarchaeum sulfurireducens]